MITITITDVDNRSKSSMKFLSRASLATEVLPSVLKSPMLRGSSFLWVDSGLQAKTPASTRAEFMCPLPVMNSGYSSTLADLVYDALASGKVILKNNMGDRFEMEMTDDHKDPEMKINSDPGTTFAVKYKGSPVITANSKFKNAGKSVKVRILRRMK